jgi:hypothetical protein
MRIPSSRFADVVCGRPDVFDGAAENQIFDLVFDVVVEFVSVRAEELDAVVGVWVVGGGDRDPGIGAKASGHVSNTWGGQRPDKQNIDTH